ncbi:MAG TPA: hypothetical protein VM101_14105 [Flavitalea sp.]|nr:hypothetical protein [Flavitalea sp.]
MRQMYLLTIFLNFLITSYAQENTKTNAGASFKIGVNYNSSLNYYGRTDSLQSSGFFPSAELWLSSDYYVSATAVTINNSFQKFKYAGTILTAGYEHATKKWATGITILKPLYAEKNDLVESALKGQVNINVTRLNSFANVSLGADVKVSDKPDIGATGGIDHLFTLPSKIGSAFIINPGIFVYAGTQQFSRTYTTHISSLPVGSTQHKETLSRFNILAIETSVPVIYVQGRIMLTITPAYIIPKNIQANAGQPQLSEQGKNIFYTSCSIKWSFNKQKLASH